MGVTHGVSLLGYPGLSERGTSLVGAAWFLT